MKKLSLIFLVFLAFALASLVGKGQVKSKSFEFVLQRLLNRKVPEISVAKAAASPTAYAFLDAREPGEFAVSHLPRAIHTGYKDFKQDILKSIPKDKPIIVYCSIGKRSENITRKLIGAGYRNVSNLYGGIFEWVNQGNEVYDNHDKPTNNVHAYNWLWGRFLEKGNKVY